jgi:adenine C2-methylase RlmN of 23S rRNA A2503 and tRNA A37
MLCHVNLIPLNKIEEMDSTESTLGAISHDDPTPGATSHDDPTPDATSVVAPSRSSAEAFRKILESRGITATLRREMGDDIDAACGQLRLRSLNQGPAVGAD